MSLFGIRVASNPFVPSTRPRMTLSLNVTVSDEFRREYNEWLEEFFGREAVAYFIDPSAVGLMGEKMILVAPSNLAMFKWNE